MKLWKIFRFELAYQVPRLSTWLYVAVLIFFAFVQTTSEFLAGAQSGDYVLNAPFVVAVVTAIVCLVWLLIAAYVAGDAAARDVETGMHPLSYTARASKTDYLGGRFFAAFTLNALILLAVPAGILLAMHSPEVEPEVLGPFRPVAYLTAYAFLALPNAFVATAFQFSFAALNRRAIAGYLGSLLLFAIAGGTALLLDREAAQLLDPTGVIAIARDNLTSTWAPIELNTRLIALEGTLLWNRLLWLGIALGTLAFTHFRFRFAHPTARTWWHRIVRRHPMHAPIPMDTGAARNTPLFVPQVRRTFGFATYTRQTLAIAGASFRALVKSRSGLLFSVVIALLALLTVSSEMEFMGVLLLPRTEHVLASLVTPAAQPGPWILIPLLIVFWASELTWQEREAGLSEIVDTAPLPEWVLFLGKFLGLSLMLAVYMGLLMAAGMLVQASMGYLDFEIGLYLQVFFGTQLASYLLLGMLALGVHVVVNQKRIGQLVIFFILFLIAYAFGSGIEHYILLPLFDPSWSYTDMPGFGPPLRPWLWFQFYWTAWALLLAVAIRLLWVRGKERGFGMRLHVARHRFTRPTAWATIAAVGLILTSGGFIFYNTNVLHEYSTASAKTQQRAEYERRYGQYEGIPQPQLTGISLHVEIYPERREVEIRGTYRLVNNSAVPIASVHLAPVPDVETGEMALDRWATLVLGDEVLGHHTYALAEPLEPGDSLNLSFEVAVESPGFHRRGVDAAVRANGTWFTNRHWLPAIGYQPSRELRDAGERQAHGLAPQPALPSLYDLETHTLTTGAERPTFEAIVGTAEDQIAIVPGALRRTWMENGRRYFHYATDVPIGNEYAFFSAAYAVHEAQWHDVAIQTFHHPGHTANLDRMDRSVRASLDYYTAQFGPYPYRLIRLIEHPGHGRGMHADAMTISSEEGFSLLNPDDGPQGFDLPFFVVAHEVAHQWWGAQLTPARVEGAGLLVESLASYSGYQVVEETYGPGHLRRLLRQLRKTYEIPRTRAAAPLLRANNSFLNYRKGPFALYALSQYIGAERVNDALRRLLQAYGSGTPPLPTSLDLYRELQAATPDSLHSLLHDLFEANTFWDFETLQATAEQAEAGSWQVTLDVRARKEVVDSTGIETPVPMDDWVEVGVFAPAQEGEELGKPLYVQRHHIRATEQSITVTVPHKPAWAGIDPYHLLIDPKMDDNIAEVKTER